MNQPQPSRYERLLAEARRRTRGPENVCPQEPTERQREFLACDKFEALYGGAAGGGKSSALLMAAAQYVHEPGYAALLLRRTYADLALPGAIMDRSKEWWHGKAEWNDKDKRWTFPSGATITFGYLDNDRDRFRYQGAELQFLGFDELTQFPEQWYRYLLSRLRRLHGVSVPLRARAASNPGGIGHDWVRRRFVESGGDTSRRFVPATLDDNPHLDATSYREALAQLDPTTRKQLLEGIWVRDSGGLVYRYADDVSCLRVPPCDSHILGIDYGFHDSTAFAVLGWSEHEPTVYSVESFKRNRLTPGDAAELALELDRKYRFVQIVGDTGGLGKGYVEEARQRFSLPIQQAEKRNKRGYIDLLNGDLATGRLRFGPGNEDLIAEMLELPWNKERTKPEDGFEDHICDALLYGWRACKAWNPEPKPAPKTHDTDERAIWDRRLAEVQREQDDPYEEMDSTLSTG